MADGGPSVMTAGTAEMLKSFVDNWDTLVNMQMLLCLASSFSNLRILGNNNSGIAVAARRAKFGPGNGFIILDEVNCNGSESSLLQCRAAEIGVHNCVSLEDSSVYCPCE